jgi:hypothetical protein
VRGDQVEQADSSTKFVCCSTFFPVRRWRHVIPFLRMSSRVQKLLKETPGLVRYELRTSFVRKRYWTFSVWKDRASIDAFRKTEPHATAMTKLNEWVIPGKSAFVSWGSNDDSVNWKEGLDRLRVNSAP